LLKPKATTQACKKHEESEFLADAATSGNIAKWAREVVSEKEPSYQRCILLHVSCVPV
jgi:hypothetical protein